MHSSRMRTGRSLPVCCSLLPGGVGGLLRGGVCSGGSAPGGSPCPGGFSLPGDPPCEQNHTHVYKHNLGHNFVAAGKNVTTAGGWSLNEQANRRELMGHGTNILAVGADGDGRLIG